MSEKIGGAKGSKLEEDFVELERVSFLIRVTKLTLGSTNVYFPFLVGFYT